jgi:small subunit ribosomal protein S27Ae
VAKKKVKNKRPSKIWTKYKINGENIERGQSCPKCESGTFLADHKDRWFCGKCHYTLFKKKETKESK